MTFSKRTGRRVALSIPRLVWSSILLALLVAVSAFVGGFFVFADQVATADSPSAPRADGIVALTGDVGRITKAIDLLSSESATRLLISGVDETTSLETLRGAYPANAELFGCCIDIGRDAHDTRGNARETRDWARARGYRSLIVVTSAYHMPRSLSEISRQLPGVDLVPVPVQPANRDLDGWMRDGSTFRLLLVEYIKYIVSRLR